MLNDFELWHWLPGILFRITVSLVITIVISKREADSQFFYDQAGIG
jgi:hypothetical protein